MQPAIKGNSMLSDIKEEPEIIRKLIKEYIPENCPVQNISIKKERISKIYIIASGSSRNVGNIARYFIEEVSKIPVCIEHASEFGERNPVLSPGDVVIFVSQSGETSDVLQALKIAKAKGVYTFAVTNNPESTIHKSADSAMFIHAGKEISIPATKSFLAQLLCLYILGIYFAETDKSLPEYEISIYKQQIYRMPEKIEKLISGTEEIDKVAEKLYQAKDLIVLGRGQNYGLAEEFALKIQETCYINSGGYPTGEFLHGHLAMLDNTTPVLSIITEAGGSDSNYNLAVNNTVKIIEKRNPPVFVLKNKSDKTVQEKLSGHKVEYLNISEFDRGFSPVYSAVVLHLLSYKMAKLLGHDVNHPRSLSKTVSE